MRNVDTEHSIVWGGICVLLVAAVAAAIWFLRGTPFAPNVEARQAVALERIADALDRAFPKPAEQEPR